MPTPPRKTLAQKRRELTGRHTLAQKRALYSQAQGQSTVSARSKRASIARLFQSHRRLVMGGGVGLLLILCLGGWISGQASRVVNVYPVVGLGAKHTELRCNYAGKDLTVTTTQYANIDQYYEHNARKHDLVDTGDLTRYVYTSSGDTTMTDLATKIKQLGSDNDMNDDQILELATCFIQNIPYDDARSKVVLSRGNDSMTEQYPYETLYKNSGICTDKTYLGSALLRALGYGTGIFVFPEDQHVALGVQVPGGYTEFGSPYAMMELTTPGFAPGELPEGIDDDSGRPAARINKLSDLDIHDDPSKVTLTAAGSIAKPTLVLDVNGGQSYTRIVVVKDLENSIIRGLGNIKGRLGVLEQAYGELNRREYAMNSAESTYNFTSSTKLDCGYKYDYSYSYSYYYSPYSYSSPYTYRCDTITNPQKSYALDSWVYAEQSYNRQVNYYNQLLAEYKSAIADTQSQIDRYKSYDYN